MGIKKIFKLISPLFLFYLLFVPYQIVNANFFVNWLGCGCPVVDEYGNTVQKYFNANDFSECFWLFIALFAVALSVLISKKEFKKKWMKILYVIIITAISFMTACFFSVAFRWK